MSFVTAQPEMLAATTRTIPVTGSPPMTASPPNPSPPVHRPADERPARAAHAGCKTLVPESPAVPDVPGRLTGAGRIFWTVVLADGGRVDWPIFPKYGR